MDGMRLLLLLLLQVLLLLRYLALGSGISCRCPGVAKYLAWWLVGGLCTPQATQAGPQMGPVVIVTLLARCFTISVRTSSTFCVCADVLVWGGGKDHHAPHPMQVPPYGTSGDQSSHMKNFDAVDLYRAKLESAALEPRRGPPWFQRLCQSFNSVSRDQFTNAPAFQCPIDIIGDDRHCSML